ncbi:MAG: hypothetical protein A2252_02775 [Elusimicrobia bacterium RIFOXYA2_FULL_39_19]|nr:MAG: hypothetical protein A2252_02775 [Elusimicrobia bacterium RIFOXYA2_FULL_39_19]
MKAKAMKYFRGLEMYNCAQTIVKACCEKCTNEDLAKYKNAGSGKAPGGLCGSVYAGGVLLADEAKAQLLEKAVQEQSGSAKCKEILKLRKMSCRDVVGLVAEFVEKNP